MAFKPKYYAEVNLKESPQNTDYLNMPDPVYGKLEDYEIISKVGRGKYANVFEGVNMTNNQRVILKALKPLTKRKIKREIFMMKRLKDGPNIIKQIDVVKDSGSHTISLIFEYVDNLDFRELYPKFTDQDVRFFMHETLVALDYCHSKGIMHRDVKPQNIVYDFNSKVQKLIDFGLSEFFFPNKNLTVRVSSQFFKAPELLLGYEHYDYSVDMWSLGCVFAAIIYKKEPFFHGSDLEDQLDKIASVLGTNELITYLEKYRIELEERFTGVFGGHQKKAWTKFVSSENSMLANKEAQDLLSQMLIYDHLKRITPKDALEHPYIKQVKGSKAN